MNGPISTISKTPSRYNPLKVGEQEQKPRLINDKFTAAIGVVLTGYITTLTLRAAFWQSPHRFHWILPLDHLLAAWVVLTANVVVYAWMVWLCIVFPRALQGKERALVAGWVPGLLLGPIQGMVSASLAADIQYVKAASIMVSFGAAVAIFLEGLQTGTGPSDRTAP
jgi:hypothetical protein